MGSGPPGPLSNQDMKLFKSYTFVLCLMLLASCEKEQCRVLTADSDIIFRTVPATKAMTVTDASNLTGFCVTGVSGGADYFSNVRTVPDGPGYERVPNFYWGDNALAFYAVYPYMDIMKAEGKGYYIRPATASKKLTGNEDIVVARTGEIASGTKPVSLEFSHILACLDSIVCYGISEEVYYSDITATLSVPRYGDYYLTDSSWLNTGVAEAVALAAPNPFSGTGSSAIAEGLSIIPSTAVLTVSYLVSSGGLSATATKKASIPFSAGKKTRVRAGLSATTGKMELTATVCDWSNSVTDIIVDPYANVFNVSPVEIYAPAAGTTVTVTVSGAGSWTVSSLPDWITASASSGTGSGSFVLTVKKNTSMESREGYVVITDGGFVRKIRVIQDYAYDAGISILPLDDNGSYGETL